MKRNYLNIYAIQFKEKKKKTYISICQRVFKIIILIFYVFMYSFKLMIEISILYVGTPVPVNIIFRNIIMLPHQRKTIDGQVINYLKKIAKSAKKNLIFLYLTNWVLCILPQSTIRIMSMIYMHSYDSLPARASVIYCQYNTVYLSCKVGVE